MELISMTCKNCGGKLSISRDAEQCICQQCGSEYLVTFRENTISIKFLKEHLENIQASSDKTASELALKRIKEDLKILWNEYHMGIIVNDLCFDGRRADKLGIKFDINEIGLYEFSPNANINTLKKMRDLCQEAIKLEKNRWLQDKDSIRDWEKNIQRLDLLIPKFQILYEQQQFHLQIVNARI